MTPGRIFILIVIVAIIRLAWLYGFEEDKKPLDFHHVTEAEKDKYRSIPFSFDGTASCATVLDLKDRWNVPLDNGELCRQYEVCESEAVGRGYLGDPLCQRHMDELALYSIYDMETANSLIEMGINVKEWFRQ